MKLRAPHLRQSTTWFAREHPYAAASGGRCLSARRTGAVVAVGAYHVRSPEGVRRFEGRVETSPFGAASAYVQDPPAELRQTRYWVCFASCNTPGLYRVLWRRGTDSLDRTIGFLERVLAESLDGRQRRARRYPYL